MTCCDRIRCAVYEITTYLSVFKFQRYDQQCVGFKLFFCVYVRVNKRQMSDVFLCRCDYLSGASTHRLLSGHFYSAATYHEDINKLDKSIFDGTKIVH